MKNLSFLASALVAALAIPVLNGHAQEGKAVKALMMRKLENSQKVLEGVALNDFDRVAKHADELITISKATDWKVMKSPQYELYSNEFRRNAETLVQQAKNKNTDGMALAYVELTLNCVKCHKHVREVRMTRLD
ncbi:MAG: hypothetical protein K2R98_14200 [Gemmataceae bacterium]|nr:hypothetical protein [Gemmataceae bacterium]